MNEKQTPLTDESARRRSIGFSTGRISSTTTFLIVPPW